MVNYKVASISYTLAKKNISARNGTDLVLEYIIGPAINAIFAIAFGLIWMRNKSMPAACLWAAAYFFAFASWGLDAIYIPLDLSLIHI